MNQSPDPTHICLVSSISADQAESIARFLEIEEIPCRVKDENGSLSIWVPNERADYARILARGARLLR